MQSKKGVNRANAESDFNEYFETVFRKIRHGWQKGPEPRVVTHRRLFGHRVRHA